MKTKLPVTYFVIQQRHFPTSDWFDEWSSEDEQLARQILSEWRKQATPKHVYRLVRREDSKV